MDHHHRNTAESLLRFAIECTTSFTLTYRRRVIAAMIRQLTALHNDLLDQELNVQREDSNRAS